MGELGIVAVPGQTDRSAKPPGAHPYPFRIAAQAWAYQREFRVPVPGGSGAVVMRLENANDSLLGGVKYSTRSVAPTVDAGDLVRSIVEGYGIGGGHASMAGGFVKHGAFPDDRSIDTFTRVRAIGFVEGASGR